MKNPFVTVWLNICLLAPCALMTSCDKHGPGGQAQATRNHTGSVGINEPNMFLPPDQSCAPVTNIRFYGETYLSGYTNWQVGWTDDNSQGHTYIVALYDSRVSTTLPIWSWQSTEKNLNIGVLEGRPDSVQTPYSIKIQVKCPTNGSSIIVIEDVAMK